nr:KAP family NTPase [Rhodothermaceae bacterium]
DFNKIREDIHVSVVQHFLTPSLFFIAVVGIIVGLGIFSGFFLSSWLLGGGISVAGPFLAGLVKWANEKRKVLNKPLEGDLAKYVNKPDYESKRGFFSEVEDDIRRVFALLVNPEEPAVVFVDDLDRCSPGKIAEVIEAINLFLSGDFPNAYFILGMDAQAVANSLEVAHEKLAAKMQKTTKRYGSMGWYFMEKMVQLPFVIPGITDDQRDDYLFELFTTEDDHPQASENEVKEIEQQANKLIEEEPADLIIEKISAQVPLEKLDRSTRRELEEKAITKGAASFRDDSTEIRRHLERYAPYLGNKPRTIKRFVNLYRFYRMAQWARQLQKLDIADPAALGRWIVIMLRWPQLVRWIQWEGEAGLLSTDKPEDKAKNIEELAENSKAFSDWVNALDERGITEMHWIREEALYRYLRLKLDDNEKLYKAVKVGVW